MTSPRHLFALCLSLTTLSVGVAAAQEARILAPEDHPEWTAIGRLNVTGYNTRSMCTATLVAPDKVLTAAHCVTRDDGHPIDPDRLRFVAGWLRGGYAAASGVIRVDGADPFRMATTAGRQAIDLDTAVLTLAAPLTAIPPLPVAAPDLGTGAQVRVLGYRQDRPHALSDTGSCALSVARTGLQSMTCPVTFGNSGGPVLQQQDGVWHVVGVISAMAGGTSHGAPLPPALSRMLDQTTP